MINTWFTSDTHFGHKNILKYEKESRPFENVYEMNEVLIERWNNVVKTRDIVYHLGDLTLSKACLPLLERLNGNKRLIMGNHDIHPMPELTTYFDKIYGAFEYKGCILTHIPIHPACMGRYKMNIHGHLHSKDISFYEETSLGPLIDIRYFNVSVEQNNLTPIHFDVIKERIRLRGGEG